MCVCFVIAFSNDLFRAKLLSEVVHPGELRLYHAKNPAPRVPGKC